MCQPPSFVLKIFRVSRPAATIAAVNVAIVHDAGRGYENASGRGRRARKAGIFCERDVRPATLHHLDAVCDTAR